MKTPPLYTKTPAYTNVPALTLLCLLPLCWTGCSQQTAESSDSGLREKVEAFAKTHQKLETRLAELEKTNRMLEGEVNVLKDQLSQASGTDEEGALNEKVAAIVNDELSELIAKKFDEQAGGEGLTQQMLAASWNQQMTAFQEQQEAEEEARREERRQEEEERRAEAQASRLIQLADDLGIDDTQAEQLQVAMETMRNDAREVFTKMREEGGGFNRDTMRDEMTKLREMHLQVTSQFLSEDQQAAYAERAERGGFGGGGFGGGGPGRGGRGGGGR